MDVSDRSGEGGHRWGWSWCRNLKTEPPAEDVRMDVSDRSAKVITVGMVLVP